MQTKYINIVDDCVSTQYQDFLLRELHAPNLVWTFSTDVTHIKETKNPGFNNIPFFDGVIKSTAYWFLAPLLYEACNKANVDVLNILRMRIGMYINRNIAKANQPHIDSSESHMVGLYYPDDFDGDTVFYSDASGEIELTRVKPKKGRMVIFDGSIYHASSNPIISSYRTTVNFNFTGNVK
jgi:hypothetical protein